MLIELWVQDMQTGEKLEDLGTCVCTSPSQAVQMYDEDIKWSDKGYQADVRWKIVEEDENGK